MLFIYFNKIKIWTHFLHIFHISYFWTGILLLFLIVLIIIFYADQEARFNKLSD